MLALGAMAIVLSLAAALDAYVSSRVEQATLIRARLLKHWRAALAVAKSPVDAWASIVQNPEARLEWQQQRGLGGFVRSTWDEVNQLIASANVSKPA
jgi:nitrate reductase alpha subunit